MKRQFALIGLVLALTGVGLFASRATSGGGGGCYEPIETAKAEGVRIKDFCYGPAVVVVKPGDKVTWVNRDRFKHNVVLSNGMWYSRGLGFRDTVSFRFDERGVFPYICTFHTGMAGAVVVGKPVIGVVKERPGKPAGHTNYTRGPGSGKVAQAVDTALAGGLNPAAAPRKEDQAVYVFLVLVGALLMVGLIFLALNRRGDRNHKENRAR